MCCCRRRSYSPHHDDIPMQQVYKTKNTCIYLSLILWCDLLFFQAVHDSPPAEPSLPPICSTPSPTHIATIPEDVKGMSYSTSTPR